MACSTGNRISPLDPDPVADQPLIALLTEGLAELASTPLPPVPIATLTRLVQLARTLERWGERINLTGHRSAEAIVRRLILDAAALERLLPQSPSLNDLGSGAGFPGLPLAILRPTCEIILVESRERRHHFQRAVVRELGLSTVSTLRGRIEEAPLRPAEVVIAQAVARPDRVVEWGLPWVAAGGWLAIPGGETPPRVASDPRLMDVRTLDYRVPLGGPARTLWLARRRSDESPSA